MIFSIQYISFNPFCHCSGVGGWTLSQDLVIIFLATKSNIWINLVCCLPKPSLGATPITQWTKSNDKLHLNMTWISRITPRQKGFRMGQSQKIWVWSPIWLQFLQHNFDLLLSKLNIIDGVLNNHITTFQPNSFHTGLFVVLWLISHALIHSSSSIIIFASNSHLPFMSKELSNNCDCRKLYKFETVFSYFFPWYFWSNRIPLR